MMMANYEYVTLFISVFVMIADVVCAVHCFAEKKKYSYVLASAVLAAGAIEGFFLVARYTDDYKMMSVFSSLHFISTSFALIILLTFVRGYTLKTGRGKRDFIRTFATVGLFIEVVLFAINPIKEIVIKYKPYNGAEGGYIFDYQPAFWGILVFSNIIIVLIIVCLIRKMKSVPAEYRLMYIRAIIYTIIISIIGTTNVHFPKLIMSHMYDVSMWTYSLLAIAMYINFYRFPVNGMKNYYYSWIVENVNQGMLFFNNEGTLIIHNKKIHSLFPQVEFTEDMDVKDFYAAINLDINQERSKDNYSFQHYVKSGEKELPIRFDHKCPRGENGQYLGELLVFTDEQGDMDLLTSFYGWESFKSIVQEEPEFFAPPLIVTVCDINGLGDINNTLGRLVGDHCIELLANTLRKHFTGESYYVRGREASLIVLSFDLTVDEAKERLELVNRELMENKEIDRILEIQSIVEEVHSYDKDVLAVVEYAFKGLKTKKLLDVNSSKSELVTSLVKTLAECDGDTEAHVKRTQAIGAELGKRLGLTDSQQGDLALLCILHDIGKISIPLEILNKPSKLSDDEWRMMKTHTSKGYQIAKSSRELEHISECILHHHECWNGRGYPDGLTKESIPLLSRIISVVDAYDAMVSDRVYRPAMSIKEAIAELKRCAGTQFDPGIVNVFVKMIPEISGLEIDESLDLLEVAKTTSKDVARYSTAEEYIGSQSTNVHTVDYCKYLLDDSMRIIDSNNFEVFERLTGYSKEDIENNSILQTDLLPEEDRVEYIKIVTERLGKDGLAYFEHRLKRKDGSIAFVFCYGKAYYDSAVKAERSEVIVFDSATTYAMKLMISEEHNKADLRLAKWEDKYRCDSLTGLLNHEAFKNDVEHHLLDENTRVMLLMMDADKFKNYNDSYGHKEGDEYLASLANSISETLRKDDLACRMGGDEFAAALFFTKDIEDFVMLKRAQQICDKLNLILTSRKGGTSVSMGAVTSDENINTFDKLYETADKALYEAKAQGRARMVIYNKDGNSAES